MTLDMDFEPADHVVHSAAELSLDVLEGLILAPRDV
jgi:hypothetical protein